MSKADVITIIRNRTGIIIGSGGLTQITQADLDKEIDAAVQDYSMDEPKTILEDKVPGDLLDVGGVKFYQLASWDFDVSSPSDVEVEFPVDQAARSILFQGQELDYEIVERPLVGVRTAYIKFASPPTGSPGTWRLRYLSKYQSLAQSATLADLTARAVQMVGLLAASYASMCLAGRFGQTVDASIVADVVDYRSKSGEWRAMSEKLFKEYEQRIDRPDSVKRGGFDLGVTDLDVAQGKSNRYGRDFLVHRRHRR